MTLGRQLPGTHPLTHPLTGDQERAALREVGYGPEPVDPPADGNVLICSACPVSPIVLDL